MQSDRTDPHSTETGRPPTRTAGGENFPVASWLIAAELRPAVTAYYDMARAADDIADDPHLSADEKLRRLDRIEAALTGTLDSPNPAPVEQIAAAAGRALAARAVPVEHATRLLRAFRRDAVQPRCADWSDLMAYCADSANPVGRFLLDLHGEDAAGHAASDALCAALQVLNHLQDIGDDYRSLDRVYLPADWRATDGVSDNDLAAHRTNPNLRRVLDRCLGEVDVLLAKARPLPLRLRSTRLALEAAVILALAEALAQRLAVLDPLEMRVRLSRPAMLGLALRAIPRCLWQRSRRPDLRDRRHPA